MDPEKLRQFAIEDEPVIVIEGRRYVPLTFGEFKELDRLREQIPNNLMYEAGVWWRRVK